MYNQLTNKLHFLNNLYKQTPHPSILKEIREIEELLKTL